MKKVISLILALVLVSTFGLFALGSGDSSDETTEQVNETTTLAQKQLKYSITIEECKLVNDIDGKRKVILIYNFTNISSDEPLSFLYTCSDKVTQDGEELEVSIICDESIEYDPESQFAEVAKGESVKVNSVYELNNGYSNVDVEIIGGILTDDFAENEKPDFPKQSFSIT